LYSGSGIGGIEGHPDQNRHPRARESEGEQKASNTKMKDTNGAYSHEMFYHSQFECGSNNRKQNLKETKKRKPKKNEADPRYPVHFSSNT